MMMYSPTTNITASSTITLLTIQCAWLNKRGTSRFAATVDAAENPGIVGNGDSMHDESGSNHRWRLRPPWTVVGALCLFVHGCDTGAGGAVELSWKLRPASSSISDKFVDCEPGQDDPNRGTVTWIQLSWKVTDDNQQVSTGRTEW